MLTQKTKPVKDLPYHAVNVAIADVQEETNGRSDYNKNLKTAKMLISLLLLIATKDYLSL